MPGMQGILGSGHSGIEKAMGRLIQQIKCQNSKAASL